MLTNGNLTNQTRTFCTVKTLCAKLFIVVLLPLLMLSSPASSEPVGRLSGRVIDAVTGEAVIGATVMLDGTGLGCKADLDGNYWIKNVPAGSYTLVVSSIQHQQKRLIDVVITDGETMSLNISLQPQATQLSDVITVQAKLEKNTNAAVLHVRQEARAITDVISSEEISRSGSGHAAEAMSKITGASVVEGKYVYIRGLGDRYTSTHLNGSPLPSPDPESQAVPTDMIPAGLLDNIVLEKTFTPDKPGNFAGGIANLNTKEYPERRSVTFSMSTGYNSQSVDADMLTHTGSSTDWLGIDDGHRDLPQVIRDNPNMRNALKALGGSSIMLFDIDSTEQIDSALALLDYVSESSRAFNKEMDFSRESVPVNRSYSLAYGDFFQIGERPLGIVANLSYSRSFKAQQNGLIGQYEGPHAESNQNEYCYETGMDIVLWGGLADINFGIHQNHKLGVSFVYTRNSVSSNEYFRGKDHYHANEHALDSLRRRWIKYTQRDLQSVQFRGEHLGVPFLGDHADNWRSEWRTSFSRTKQEEPDARYLADIKKYMEDEDDGSPYFLYIMNETATDQPYRAWRELNESNNEYRYDLTIPVSKSAKLKTGLSFLEKDRTFTDERFEYRSVLSYESFDGDVEAYISDVGGYSIDTVAGGRRLLIKLDNFLQDASNDINQYSGFQEIFATYLMLSTPLSIISDRLSFVGGVRYETTRMHGEVDTDRMEPGDIDEYDYLPSANLIYKLSDNMNLRASYSKTLARPTIREITPSHSEEFGNRRLYVGNEDLVHTRIDNYDLRWEWFTRPGEVIAASVFHKDLDHPIELVILGQNGDRQTQNVEHGEVTGIELEYRRRLDWLTERLDNFQIGANLTLVSSSVDVPVAEKKDYPEVDHTRPLANQSPYVVNLDLGYSNSIGTSASIFYNVFGRRLAVNSTAPTADIYEESHQQLDLLVSQRLFGGPKLKLSVKNILNEDIIFKYDHQRPDGSDAIYKSYSVGVSYGLGVSYDIW